MQTILLVLHVAMGLALIAVILLQQGTGATAGAAFGSGASSTVFGARSWYRKASWSRVWAISL